MKCRPVLTDRFSSHNKIQTYRYITHNYKYTQTKGEIHHKNLIKASKRRRENEVTFGATAVAALTTNPRNDFCVKTGPTEANFTVDGLRASNDTKPLTGAVMEDAVS